MNTNKSKRPAMAALKYPIDRQGTLYVDGNMCSEGIFHTHQSAGLYVQSMHSPQIPTGNNIVLNADSGENIEIDRIHPCPHGEPHHHFEIDV